jgi:ADP-ribose pyrophosphatase
MSKNEDKFWKVIDSKHGFKGNWIDLKLEQIILPDGKQIEFEALNYHRAGVGIVAENDKGEIVLVKSYRYINDVTAWEVPAGTVSPEQSHKDCIIDELREEAGSAVDEKDLKYIGSFYPSIGSSNQLFHCYYAKNVRQVTEDFDKNEILDVKWFTKTEIKKMILDGEIKDGFALLILMKVLLFF